MSGVVTYYLEMKSHNPLKDKKESAGFSVKEDEIKQYQVNQFLYQFIGAQWGWVDKLSLPDEQWQQYVERDQLKTYIAYFKGTIAGYYELEQQQDGDVEIAIFGLVTKFIGQGFGRYLLSHAIQSAWALQGTKRVWLHTCTMDHHSALKNYQARGFKIYRETKDS